MPVDHLRAPRVPDGRGRLLGLDLGSRRIGVAACDDGRSVATGVATVERTSDPVAHRRALRRLVDEYEAVGVVVGLPLSLSGQLGPAATAALDEVEALRAELGVPVDTVDERLTTVAVSGALRAGGRDARRARQVVDREAAATILQSWLDRRRAASR